MDLNLLYVFTSIYRELSLTRAAEHLGISTPGVSAALRRLRNEFQDPLFIRKSHGVEPTVRADIIAEKFGIALGLVEEAKRLDDHFSPAREERNFIIGMSDFAVTVILPHLLARLGKEAPGINLAIQHPGNQTVRNALEDSDVDLMIGHLTIPSPRIRQQQLLKESFRAVSAQNHPLAQRAFSPKELNDYPALLTEAHGNERWWECPSIKSKGYSPVQVFSLPDFLGLSMLLPGSPFICVTTNRLSRIALEHHPLTILPSPFDNLQVSIRQYWHERWHTDPGHRWLRQVIHEVCQDLEEQEPAIACESCDD